VASLHCVGTFLCACLLMNNDSLRAVPTLEFAEYSTWCLCVQHYFSLFFFGSVFEVK
jgi:hypothetical protein